MIKAEETRNRTAEAKQVQVILPQIEEGMLQLASQGKNRYETAVHHQNIVNPICDVLEAHGYAVEAVPAAQPLHFFLRIRW